MNSEEKINLEKEISTLVSNFDIEKKFNNSDKIKIKVYSDLAKYDSLLDLLPNPICSCFILLRTSSNNGHWTSITRYNNTITYFDSYGIGPDMEFKNIDSNIRYQLGENKPLLTDLLKTLPASFHVQYNKIPFQSHANNVNTCGKWNVFVVKSIFKGRTLQEIQQSLKNFKKEYNVENDIIICALWDSLI